MSHSQAKSSKTVSVICGDHFRAVKICMHLEDAGLTALCGDFKGPVDVLLFDLLTCSPAIIKETIEFAFSQEAKQPILASVGRCNIAVDLNQFDVSLSSDHALNLASYRFDFADRILAKTNEAALRQQSFVEFGHQPEHKHNDYVSHPKRVLYVGAASRYFSQIDTDLGQRGLSVKAAFSAYTSFDYLHEHDFDAVIMDLSEGSQEIHKLCSLVRRSPSLINIPVLLLANDQVRLSDDILSCATDLIETSEDNFVAQVWDGLKRLHTAQQIEKPNVSAIVDQETLLFSEPFFRSHLERQLGWSQKMNQSLCLLVLKVVGVSSSGVPSKSDIVHAAKVVTTLLRNEDVPAQIDESHIVVALPGSTQSAAERAAFRLEAVLDSTAFEVGLDQPARQIQINWRVLSCVSNETVSSLLERALSDQRRSDADHRAA